MVKKHEILNGKIQSKNFCCSMNKDLLECLTLKYGGQTEIIREFFITRLELKDEWELEEKIKNYLLEEIKLGKRIKLSKELAKTMSEKAIKFCNEELKKDEEWDQNAMLSFREWKKIAKKIKGVRGENEES